MIDSLISSHFLWGSHKSTKFLPQHCSSTCFRLLSFIRTIPCFTSNTFWSIPASVVLKLTVLFEKVWIFHTCSGVMDGGTLWSDTVMTVWNPRAGPKWRQHPASPDLVLGNSLFTRCHFHHHKPNMKIEQSVKGNIRCTHEVCKQTYSWGPVHFCNRPL